MKTPFKFPMRRSERILGNIYLPIHVFLLPWLLVFVYTNVLNDMDAVLQSPSMNLIYYVIGFVFIFIFLFRFLKTSFSDLADNLVPSLQAIVLAYFLNFAAVYLLSLFLSYVMDGSVNPNSLKIAGELKRDAHVIIVAAVLLAPIVEETLFRGALFGTLRGRNRLLAYAVSALAFAVYHMWQYFLTGFEWQMLLFLLQYIPPSIALCWCYEKSGSIWAPITLHALVNFISIQMLIG